MVNKENEYDVIVIGGGATGAGTARDCACIKENMILRKVASHCVEENDGLFITLPEDDLAYQATFVKSCQEAGINAEIIDPELAKRMEPSVNPTIVGAVKVPDGSVDPFRLTLANIIDAKAHGAKILVYHEVLSLVKEQNRVIGVEVFDHKTKEKSRWYLGPQHRRYGRLPCGDVPSQRLVADFRTPC